MFVEILENFYKLKAGDLSSKYHIIAKLDDDISKCDVSNVAFLPKREFLSLICLYRVKAELLNYDRAGIGTYEFRKMIDKIKNEIGLNKDDSIYKIVTESEAEELKEIIDIGLSGTNEEVKQVLEGVNDALFEE